MNNQDLLSSVTVFDVRIYTGSYCCSGWMQAQNGRLSDFLNTSHDEFITVFEATVDQLFEPVGHVPWRMQFVQIRRDSIVFAVPVDPLAGREKSPAVAALAVEKDQHRVKLGAFPFAIDGTIHVAPGVQIRYHIDEPHLQFMPVTDAAVTYIPNRLSDFRAPVVLLNRDNLQVLMVAGAAAQPAAPAPAAPIRMQPVSAAAAWQALDASGVCQGVNLDYLQEALGDLVSRTLIAVKECAPGAMIFGSGDIGDTLYLIESGAVELLMPPEGLQPPRRLAELGPGGFFGEMAVQGSRARTTSARALAPTRLLAIHALAIKELVAAAPALGARLRAQIAAAQDQILAFQSADRSAARPSEEPAPGPSEPPGRQPAAGPGGRSWWSKWRA